MAALTRSGARKASEIVMFTFCTLQPSRPAMLSVFAVGSAMSSSSQRRPRAIESDSKTGESDISIWANCDFSIWRLHPLFAERDLWNVPRKITPA
jgi:hypothetical protein